MTALYFVALILNGVYASRLRDQLEWSLGAGLFLCVPGYLALSYLYIKALGV